MSEYLSEILDEIYQISEKNSKDVAAYLILREYNEILSDKINHFAVYVNNGEISIIAQKHLFYIAEKMTENQLKSISETVKLLIEALKKF